MDYKTAWNLVVEVVERLAGKNGPQFAEDLGLFLKGGMQRKEVKAEGPKRKLARALRKKKKEKIRFIVRDRFKKNSSAVRFYGFGDNFEKWFLGKVEELTKVELPKRHHDLEHDSLDAEILTDLGGKEAAEVTLAGVFALLELQPKGESGELLTNGCANIFYIKDVVGGVLRAVHVLWDGVGWHVYAGSVTASRRWLAGLRVFSRNS